jgi:hypothetical protein
MLIPNIIVFELMLIGVMACQLVLWAPTLFTGQYPPWGYSFCGGALRWAANISAFGFGLTDAYPPFGGADRGSSYPVHVSFDIPPNRSRFFAVPVLGILARYVMLIPHSIIVGALGVVAVAMSLVAWFPVLTTGRYPDWAFSFISGYIRWAVRVYSYYLGLTDKYPPFQMGN